VEQGAEALGGLDLLVANAGGSSGGDLLDSTPEDWARTYAVNVLHAAHAVRTAVPHLERSGGAAVLVSLQQVTDVACFLLSGRASGINGADICVDGAQDRPSDLRFFP
jgi:NAD(P)-dependent dehydrogenase (short-subunit alcohol dehydrogenase family)